MKDKRERDMNERAERMKEKERPPVLDKMANQLECPGGAYTSGFGGFPHPFYFVFKFVIMQNPFL